MHVCWVFYLWHTTVFSGYNALTRNSRAQNSTHPTIRCSGFWWRTGGHFDICNAFYLVLPYPILSRTSAYFVKFVVPWRTWRYKGYTFIGGVNVKGFYLLRTLSLSLMIRRWCLSTIYYLILHVFILITNICTENMFILIKKYLYRKHVHFLYKVLKHCPFIL